MFPFDDHTVSSILMNDIDMLLLMLLLLSEYVKFVSMLFSFINVSNMWTICVSRDFGERESLSFSCWELGECG